MIGVDNSGVYISGSAIDIMGDLTHIIAAAHKTLKAHYDKAFADEVIVMAGKIAMYLAESPESSDKEKRSEMAKIHAAEIDKIAERYIKRRILKKGDMEGLTIVCNKCHKKTPLSEAHRFEWNGEGNVWYLCDDCFAEVRKEE